MRKNGLRAGGLWLVLAGVLASAPLQAQRAPEGTEIGTVQLLVWNRAGQTIDVEVRLGKETVYASPVRNGSAAASMEAARVVQREPGTYLVQVMDRTRKLQDSVSVRIDGTQGQNVGVHLTRDGVAFVVTRGDVTGLTPPPATGDGSGGVSLVADVSRAVAALLERLEP
jgi:hypothetical protein